MGFKFVRNDYLRKPQTFAPTNNDGFTEAIYLPIALARYHFHLSFGRIPQQLASVFIITTAGHPYAAKARRM